MDDFIEVLVCKENEIEENSMKVFDLDKQNEVLLIRQNGKISALGTKCTHYDAPLVTGALGDGRLRCPWHGACFRVDTGDIEDSPGLDSLPCFQVDVDSSGSVKVRARKSDLGMSRRVKAMAQRNHDNKETYIIVGAGPAGSSCAETLRQEMFTGNIILIGNEENPPYDRTRISKNPSVSADSLLLRTEEYYQHHGIDLLASTTVTSVDFDTKIVHLKNGASLWYNKMFIATGAKARTIPGTENMKNIFTLRTVEDAQAINKSIVSSQKSVVVIGSSFIGMEISAYFVKKCKCITVVSVDKYPFARVLGEKIGERIQKMFEDNGVNFILKAVVKRINQSTSGESLTVELENGTSLTADIILLGIGVTPNTEFLANTELSFNQTGYINANQYLETNIKDIYAGGDVVFAPVLGTKAAIGHWQLSQYHGRIAARNMAGKAVPLSTVPFFWSAMFGTSIRYAGYSTQFDDVVIEGSLENLKFSAYFCEGDVVRAIATMNMDPLAVKFAEYLSQGKTLRKGQIVDENPLL